MLDKRGNKVMDRLGRFTLTIEKLNRALEKVFRWGAPIIMVVITYEVFLRYLLHRPAVWGVDLRVQIYGLTIMVSCGYTLMIRGHVTMDILMVNLPLKTARLLEFWNYILFFAPTILAITIGQTQMAMRAWAVLEKARTVYMAPIYPFMTLMSLAYLDLLLTGISEAIKCLITYRNGDEEWLKER